MRAKASSEFDMEEHGLIKKRQMSKRNSSYIKPQVRVLFLEIDQICFDKDGDGKTFSDTLFYSQEPNIRDELGNAFLLVVLYMVQGIPLGLSMGSMYVFFKKSPHSHGIFFINLYSFI
jgi:hypothetical protein